MIIRQATRADSAALIELTALAPMQGTISLRIDRKPDFFSLLQARGDYRVLVAEDKEGKVVGSFSVARQVFTVHGKEEPVYYLGDLKVHPQYVKTALAHRLVKKMHGYLMDVKADLLLCTAADGNAAVFPFFRGRAGIPKFRTASTFNIYQVLPKRFEKKDRVVQVKDTALLQAFYNAYFNRFYLHPAIYGLQDCLHFGMVKNNILTASLSLYDPGHLKQNVVVSYPVGLSLAIRFLKKLKRWLPLPPLPEKGAPLRLLYIRYFGYTPAGEKDFLALLQAARTYAFKEGYHFLAMAVDAKDKTLNRLVKKYSRFNFKSHSLITSLQGNEALLDEVCSNTTYEDYSLV